jgi:hypothetical protein
MGMDPVGALEAHEITVQLTGKVAVKEFDKYQAELDKFIKAASAIQDAAGNKLQVRVVREAVRPTGP